MNVTQTNSVKFDFLREVGLTLLFFGVGLASGAYFVHGRMLDTLAHAKVPTCSPTEGASLAVPDQSGK